VKLFGLDMQNYAGVFCSVTIPTRATVFIAGCPTLQCHTQQGNETLLPHESSISISRLGLVESGGLIWVVDGFAHAETTTTTEFQL